MRVHRRRPSRLARRLLERLVPEQDREFVVGDVEERFRRLPERGWKATWWLWREVASTLGALWQERRRREAGMRRRAGQQRRTRSRAFDLWTELRAAVRSHLRRPLWSSLALLVLALGLGANVALFSVVRGVLLAPLDLPEPGRLVALWTADTDTGATYNSSGPNILDWNRLDVFEGVYAYLNDSVVVDGEDGVRERVPAGRLTANALRVLQVEPALGRAFLDEEVGVAPSPVAILSHRFWSDRLGGDPAAVGRPLRIDGADTLVVGVLPVGLEIPRLEDADLLLPFQQPIDAVGRGEVWLGATGRLRDGVELSEARAAIATLHQNLLAEHPDELAGSAVVVRPVLDDLTAAVRPALLVLLAATALLMILACANVGNLLLARSLDRRNELALRRALGAGRARLGRQMLLESGLLAGAATVLAVAVAAVAMRGLSAIAPVDTPRLDHVGLDLGVLLFAGAAGLLSTIVCASASLWVAARSGTPSAGARATTAGVWRGALVVAQVALATLLLAGAGLLLSSLCHLASIEPGLRTRGVLAARFEIPPDLYQDRAGIAAIHDSILEGARALPGVEEAALTMTTPLTEMRINYGVRVEGRPKPEPEDAITADLGIVSAGYFRALDVPIVVGRPFAESDDLAGRPVVIVSRTMAEWVWPDEDPLGRRLALVTPDTWDDPTWLQVVGVAADVKQNGPLTPRRNLLYLSMEQRPQPTGTLLASTVSDPDTLAAALQRVVHEAAPGVPIPEVTTMVEISERNLARPRFDSTLLGLFALLALTLSAAGIYGVLAYTVSSRRRELGIRLALGAGGRRVLESVARQGAQLVAAGLVLGLAATLAVGRLLGAVVHGVSPHEPRVLVAAAILIASLALPAILVPAARAARVDPARSLRDE